ncbi:hypothetical protein ACP70R_001700 [Stipagrostis hirtigluma subsp. patula]
MAGNPHAARRPHAPPAPPLSHPVPAQLHPPRPLLLRPGSDPHAAGLEPAVPRHRVGPAPPRPSRPLFPRRRPGSGLCSTWRPCRRRRGYCWRWPSPGRKAVPGASLLAPSNVAASFRRRSSVRVVRHLLLLWYHRTHAACLPSGEEGEALTIEQIVKAYRTQSRLRHPDKRPDDPNATADFQRFSSSSATSPSAASSTCASAPAARPPPAASRAAAAGVKHRKAVSDLEERERAATAGQPADPAEAARHEPKRKAADIKSELDEFFAAKQAAASSAASTSAHGDKKPGTTQDGVKTDKGKILKVSWDGSPDYYTAAKLEVLFKKFGEVEDIVITRKSRSRGSVIVVMATKEPACFIELYFEVPQPASAPPSVFPNLCPLSRLPKPEPKGSLLL